MHRFRYLNGVPLNDAHFQLEVNFLEYWEIRPSGKSRHFPWVTNIPVSEANAMRLMCGARARWKIEKETFNTLKNQGYHFEHNFGHGYRHLSTVLAYLMLLAFMIDQIQQHCCALFKRALEAELSKSRFWRQVRGLFLHYLLPDWEALYRGIADGLRQIVIPYNTS